MHEEPLFIRPNLVIEGLVDQFYAWTYLIPPATAAMNLANLHLPMMDSFIQSPHVHAAAAADPKMQGGYFINYAEERLAEVRALRERVATENACLVGLAEAIKKASDMLRTRATGYDLTPLYSQLPAELRGYVELVYDLDNRASLRFIEPLLYRSRYHREERQSVELLLDDGRERPFILSTPRLPRPGNLQLPVPLRHRGIDELFAMRNTPKTFSRITAALEIEDEAAGAQLSRYLSAETTFAADREVHSGGRIRYFGHACLVLQSPTVNIVVDPFVSANSEAGDGRFTYADLPEHIDYCLITHGHQDHIVLETLLQIRGRTDLFVVPKNGSGTLPDPSLKLLLQSLGFTVCEMDTFDRLEFKGGEIVACPFLGEHSDLDIQAKATYWIRLDDKRIFVDADSSGIEPELYRRVYETVGHADIAFLGMECDGAPLTWLYGALFTQPVDHKMSISRKLSGSNAVQALGIVDHLGAGEAYVYAMGEEEWLHHVMATSYTAESYQLKQVDEFLDACAQRGIKAEHLFVRRELRW